MHAMTTNTISTENLKEDSTNQGNALEVLKNKYKKISTEDIQIRMYLHCGVKLSHITKKSWSSCKKKEQE